MLTYIIPLAPIATVAAIHVRIFDHVRVYRWMLIPIFYRLNITVYKGHLSIVRSV